MQKPIGQVLKKLFLSLMLGLYSIAALAQEVPNEEAMTEAEETATYTSQWWVWVVVVIIAIIVVVAFTSRQRNKRKTEVPDSGITDRGPNPNNKY